MSEDKRPQEGQPGPQPTARSPYEVVLDVLADELERLRGVQRVVESRGVGIGENVDNMCKVTSAIARIKLDALRLAVQMQAMAAMQVQASGAEPPARKPSRNILEALRRGPGAPRAQKDQPGEL